MEHRTRNDVVAAAMLATAGHMAVAGWAGDERADGTWDLTQVPGPVWASWIYVVLGLMIWSQHGGRAGRLTVAIGLTWLLYALRHLDHPALAAIGQVTPTVLFALFACLMSISKRVFPCTLAALVIGLLGWLGGQLSAAAPFVAPPRLDLLFPAFVAWPVEALIWTARTRLRRVRTLAAENARLHREIEYARGEAIEAMDAGRRSVERDLHDGAQQRLVNLGLSLSLAQARFTGPPEASAALDRAMTELDAALGELRELARGAYPAVLIASGLGPALRSLAERAALPVVLTGLPARRLPPRVEENVYFVVSEAIANATKHARASEVVVAFEDTHDGVRLTVSDDGAGGADPDGHGLRGLADRVAALGGRFILESPPGRGTRMTAVLPAAVPAASR